MGLRATFGALVGRLIWDNRGSTDQWEEFGDGVGSVFEPVVSASYGGLHIVSYSADPFLFRPWCKYFCSFDGVVLKYFVCMIKSIISCIQFRDLLVELGVFTL